MQARRRPCPCGCPATCEAGHRQRRHPRAALEPPATPRRYRRAATYGTVYSSDLETTLVRVETDDGRVGWGEAQAPVVPEASAAIVEHLLGPMLVGEPLPEPEAWWDVMYDAMRVRGHHGGFYVDAMAGVDLALWDLAGQQRGAPGVPAAQRRAATRRCRSTSPDSPARRSTRRSASARAHAAAGAPAFKLFLDDTPDALLATLDRIRHELDRRHHAHGRRAVAARARGGRSLADAPSRRGGVAWLEAPLAPEDVAGHAALARRSAVPIALGENLRTTFEVQPFLDAGAVHVLQPDLGRTGLTGARRIAALAAASGVARRAAREHRPRAPDRRRGALQRRHARRRPGSRPIRSVYTTAQRFQTHQWSWDVHRVEVPPPRALDVRSTSERSREPWLPRVSEGARP